MNKDDYTGLLLALLPLLIGFLIYLISSAEMLAGKVH